MPRICLVTGSFSQGNRPVQGLVRFTPSRLWVVEDGITWGCLAPTTELDDEGSFTVGLTPTDTDSVPWYYLVQTPAGNFKVVLSQNGAKYSFKELIDHPPHSY
jgi:hypothetical protein